MTDTETGESWEEEHELDGSLDDIFKQSTAQKIKSWWNGFKYDHLAGPARYLSDWLVLHFYWGEEPGDRLLRTAKEALYDYAWAGHNWMHDVEVPRRDEFDGQAAIAAYRDRYEWSLNNPHHDHIEHRYDLLWAARVFFDIGPRVRAHADSYLDRVELDGIRATPETEHNYDPYRRWDDLHRKMEDRALALVAKHHRGLWT